MPIKHSSSRILHLEVHFSARRWRDTPLQMHYIVRMDIEMLTEEFGVEVREAAPLREYTTFKLGGPCCAMVFCEDSGSLGDVARCLLYEREPFLTIGEGSNLLVADKGIDCIVVRFLSLVPEIALESG